MRTDTLTWQDVEEIARDLATEYPGIDPLSISLPEVRTRVAGLKRFGDEPEAATDPTLEAIQAAWYDAYQE